MPDIDKYRQDIVFTENLSGESLTFNTTWGLFSPRKIDEGTLLLLKCLKVRKNDTCLDLGCGYGPIGVWMAKNALQGQVHMVDKDFIAIEYARKNIQQNHLTNARAYLSNGFSHIKPEVKFDLITSNVPAKVGRELLTIILHDARQRLTPGGQLVLVAISGLRKFIKNSMLDTFGNYKKLKQGRSYTVAKSYFGNIQIYKK